MTMTDREKIVKGLEICSTGHCEISCPFHNVPQCTRAILSDALALLKEQEAVPVIQREVMHMLVWCCGSCGVAITDGDKFCRLCGRKVKWE